MSQTKVLVVDDEEAIRELFVDTLQSRGYEVFATAEGSCAVSIAQEENPDVAFLDIKMPGMDGVELLRRLRSLLPHMRVIMITGYSEDEAVAQALRLGAVACLMKPFSLREILDMVEFVSLAA
jgi:CheY-like chemotaxis protein